MRAGLPYLFAAISLALALAAAVMWIRSYFVHDIVLVLASRRYFVIHSTAGQIALDDEPARIDIGHRVVWRTETPELPTRQTDYEALYDFRLLSQGPGRACVFPHWVVVLLFTTPPALASFRRRKLTRRRLAARACVQCGYDLTGNVSGVCPECGGTAGGK